MFDKIEKSKVEDNIKSEKGFQIIVKNLDNGETVIDSKTRAIIGAFEEGEEKGGAVSVRGIVITSCNTKTLIGTIEAADTAVAETKKKVIEGLPPELLLAAILGDKLK